MHGSTVINVLLSVSRVTFTGAGMSSEIIKRKYKPAETHSAIATYTFDSAKIIYN